MRVRSRTSGGALFGSLLVAITCVDACSEDAPSTSERNGGFGGIDDSLVIDPLMDVLPSGDLTGDGIEDLLIHSQSDGGSLHVFAGSASFEARTASDEALRVRPPVGCGLRGPFLLHDADEDGQTDIIVGLACDAVQELLYVPGPITADVQLDERTLRIAETVGGTLPSRLGVGDLTGDGLTDLIATYPDSPNQAGVVSGLVRVLHDFRTLVDSANVDRGKVEVFATIEGQADVEHFGNDIDSVTGDLNGNGYDDLLVGAHHAEPAGYWSGAAYLFSGPLQAGTHQARDIAYAVIEGTRERDLVGVSVAVGDFDLDGRLDAMIGSDEEDSGGNYAGRVAIFPGPVQGGTRPITTASKSIVGGPFDEIGSNINTHGDLDGDGANDVLAFGCCAHDGSEKFVGILLGVYARSHRVVVSSASADFAARGDVASDHWGNAVVPGDLNGDGFDDFAVGQPAWDGDRGRVYVIFGGPAIRSGKASAVADLHIEGASQADRFGGAVLTR